MVWTTLKLTAASLPLNVIFILCCLLLYNGIARRIHPRLTFSAADLLVIYIVLAVSGALTGYDSLVGLMSVLGHTTWNATPENDWSALFGGHLPKWLLLTDPDAVRDFYKGEVDFFEGGYWEYWFTPALNWMVFFILLAFLLLCITVLLRRPWTEQEKLTYPIIQLPLEMSNPGTRLFRNRLMWMGFAVAAIVDIINGLHYLYPSFPAIPVRGIDLQTYFTSAPWNAMGVARIRFRFFMIGMTYLLPLDLSVSCWVFYLIPVPDLKATNSFSRISDSGDLLRISSRLIQIWYDLQSRTDFRKGPRCKRPRLSLRGPAGAGGAAGVCLCDTVRYPSAPESGISKSPIEPRHR